MTTRELNYKMMALMKEYRDGRPCNQRFRFAHTVEMCRECLQECRVCPLPQFCKVPKDKDGDRNPLPYFVFVSCATEAQKTAGLPERQTEHAAGYDFVCPETVTIQPGQMVMFDTGIKAYMRTDTMLMLFVRSSIGIKSGIILANGTGIIDADYADNPDNEGNIRAALYNRTDTAQTIQAGERYMQGVFVPFLTVPGETVSGARRGGIGSTDRV